jgi:hypothetical protein
MDTASAINSLSASHLGGAGRMGCALVALLALALTVPVREAHGQGTVCFNNRIANAAANQTGHIWGPSTTMPSLSFIGLGSNDSPPGTKAFGSASGMALVGAGGSDGHFGYATTFAQLLAAPGSNANLPSLRPAAGVTTFRSGTALGDVAMINSTLANVPRDAPWATVVIVAWDNSSGRFPSWTEASAGWMAGLIRAGCSAPMNVANIGGTFNPPPLLTSAGAVINGLSFNLYGDCMQCIALVATSLAASSVSTTSATLNGAVIVSGYPTTVWFEWGTSESYGSLTAATNMGSGTNLSAPLVGLTPNTTYHFRAAAQDNAWLVYGRDQSFTTPMPQTAATLPASDIAATSATLNGTVNPNGWPTTAWFQWGATTGYGNLTSVTNLGSGTNTLPVAAALAGLTPGTTFHFRAAASNSVGVIYGADQSFDSALATLIIKTGIGYWDTNSSTLSYTYKEGASAAGSPYNFILLQSADPTAPLSAWTRTATNKNIPGSFPIPRVGTASPKYYRVKAEQRPASALTPMIIRTGRGCWDSASSSLSYDGGGSVDGTPRSFVLLQSLNSPAPLSAWMRVATNSGTPGSFPIPPVGTAARVYYRVKSE